MMLSTLCLLVVSVVTLEAIIVVPVPVQQYSNGWFKAEIDICFNVQQTLTNWTIVLTSDQAVSYFFAPSAHVAEIKDGGKTFVLKNKSGLTQIRVGDKLSVPVEGHASGSTQPNLRATLENVPSSTQRPCSSG
ncbi:endoglucanase 4-like isoform X1 [Biomphalaria pfeifferi]|uniref:Endoglucanase 4-like isoform X1 n=1 Tax=Biomphalaria pfeifferi TaxID=112525 RepID=A0AAD8B2P2_BIOPF|nr:endoglucanase 4-like isoform X1 [Biomphalaria pfeifferi]